MEVEMVGQVHKLLQQIDDDYVGGAPYEALAAKVVDIASRISKMRKNDPVRKGAEAFAPLLRGAASGSPIRTSVVKAALASSDGGSYLRSWSNVGRGLLAFRVAA
jgi:hypothetical protein